MTTVADVMTPGVESTSSTEVLCDAARTMREGDFGSMPVVDDGRLVGVLTDRDIVVRAVAERRDPAAVRVGEVASRDPITIAPGDGLDAAMELMARHKVRRLPVVEGGRLVGVVSQADIALGAREAKTGAVVEQISQPTSVARER
jgi:CBS domain-containing protein